MEYHFKIHKEINGYWAECVELDGCNTQGDSVEELNLNMSEVLDLFLAEPSDSKYILPLPKKKVAGKNISKIAVSPQIAFSMLLRQYRLEKGYSQRQAAKKIGKKLYSYQKLESAKTSNPTLKTLDMLKKYFPELKLNLVFDWFTVFTIGDTKFRLIVAIRYNYFYLEISKCISDFQGKKNIKEISDNLEISNLL